MNVDALGGTADGSDAKPVVLSFLKLAGLFDVWSDRCDGVPKGIISLRVLLFLVFHQLSVFSGKQYSPPPPPPPPLDSNSRSEAFDA